MSTLSKLILVAALALTTHAVMACEPSSDPLSASKTQSNTGESQKG